MNVPLTRAFPILLVAMLLWLIGCGGGGSSGEDQAKNTAVSFYEALGKEDYEAACALLSSRASDNEQGVDCPKSMKDTIRFGPIEHPEVLGVKMQEAPSSQLKEGVEEAFGGEAIGGPSAEVFLKNNGSGSKTYPEPNPYLPAETHQAPACLEAGMVKEHGSWKVYTYEASVSNTSKYPECGE